MMRSIYHQFTLPENVRQLSDEPLLRGEMVEVWKRIQRDARPHALRVLNRVGRRKAPHAAPHDR